MAIRIFGISIFLLSTILAVGCDKKCINDQTGETKRVASNKSCQWDDSSSQPTTTTTQEGSTTTTTQPAACVLNTDWSIVDNYVSADYASGRGIAIGLNGTLYTVGIAKISASPVRFASIVRKSSDNGISWTLADSYQYGANTGPHTAQGIAVDSQGRIVAVGFGEDNSGNNHWITRVSSDNGVSWSTLDDFQLVINKSAMATAVTIDNNDNIYVSGSAILTDNSRALVVRKSLDSGATWSTIQSYQRTAGFNSEALGITINPFSGLLVAASTLNDTVNTSFFSTRASSDFWGGWTNVDEYRIASGSNVYGNSYDTIFENSTNWVAFGNANESSGLSHLIARRTVDSGASWTTVLNETYNGIFYKSILAHDGYFYSVGYKYPVGWKVRKSSIDFSTSLDIDTYNYSGTDSIAYGVIQDSQKNIFVVGYSGNSPRRFIVRKLSCE